MRLRTRRTNSVKRAPILTIATRNPQWLRTFLRMRFSFDIFFNIVRPSFHRDFNEEDLIAVFKRSAVVVFTEVGIYVRPPSTKKEHVKRHAWPDKDRGMVFFLRKAQVPCVFEGQAVRQRSRRYPSSMVSESAASCT